MSASGGDTTVSVMEVTKGQGSLDTFTLQWGGVPSRPIAFNATAEEVSQRTEHLLIAAQRLSPPLTVTINRQLDR